MQVGGSTLINSSQDTALVGCVIGTFFHVGVVAAANELLEDVQTTGDLIGVLASDGHTTHITAAVEGTYVTGVVVIVLWVAVGLAVEDNIGLQVHGDTFHIGGEHRLIVQVKGVILIA